MNASSLLNFLTTYVRPVLDVGILAFLIYQAYQLLVMTEAVYLIRGILILVVVYGAAFFLNLSTVTWIMNILATGLVVSLAIILQPELQADFYPAWTPVDHSQEECGAHFLDRRSVFCHGVLSGKRRGALIVHRPEKWAFLVYRKRHPPRSIISTSLLISVFEHDNPLHDGAAIISQGRTGRCGCFLPLSDQQDIRKTFGFPHRAALGIAEESDAVVLIASEETGALSLSYDSKLYYDLSPDEVLERLRTLFSENGVSSQTGEVDNEP
jgi:diadenylate cyclase